MKIERFFVKLLLLSFIIWSIGCKKEENKPQKPAQKVEQKKEEKKEAKKEQASQETKKEEKKVVNQKQTNGIVIEKPKGPVAKVNGEEITADEYYAEISKIIRPQTKIPKNRFQRIKENILKRLIDKKLIEQAIKKANIKVTDEEVEKAFKEYKAKFKTEAQFQNYLKYGRTTIDKIKQRLREKLALKKLLEKKYDLSVKEDEIKDFYNKNIKFYKVRESVQIRQILVRVPKNADEATMKKINEKLEKIKKALKNSSFEEVAKKYSEDITGSKGGSIITIYKGRYLKPVTDVAFMLKEGEISKPIKSRLGYHIIKLIKKIPESVKSFDEVKDKIRKTLENRNFYTYKRKLLEELKKSAKIEKFL